jgi:thymidylate synthase (FAD)
MQVLDHGYVEFVEAWGTGHDGNHSVISDDFECGIIEAARQSTQGSFRGWAEDAKLLKRLHDNNHATPFEFAGMVIEVQAPIFVFREWHRHRTQSYNEMSARYAPVPSEKYFPKMERVLQVNLLGQKNKQASGVQGIELTTDAAMEWFRLLEIAYEAADNAYQFGLNVGVAKELARCPMPVGNYSRMRASANLRNWLSFLTLRMDPLAQWEIQQFANAVGECIKSMFPQTWRLFSGARP